MMRSLHDVKRSGSRQVSWQSLVFLLVVALFVTDIAAAAESASKGKQALDELVAKAKQEGELVATIQSSWSKGLIQPLTDAFKKRFALDIKVTIANVNSARHFPVA